MITPPNKCQNTNIEKPVQNVTAVDDEMMLQVQTATVVGDVVVVEDELAYSA